MIRHLTNLLLFQYNVLVFSHEKWSPYWSHQSTLAHARHHVTRKWECLRSACGGRMFHESSGQMSTEEWRTLRSVVEQHIVRLLEERRGRDVSQLKRMVLERITAVVEHIFTEYQAGGAAGEAPPSTPSHDQHAPEGHGSVVLQHCRECKKRIDKHSEEAEPLCDLCRNKCAFDRPHTDQKGAKLHTRTLRVEMVQTRMQQPLVCKECGKDFPRKSSLERHVKLHAGDRPFICEYCGKTFMEKAVLKRHLKNHTGGRPRIHACDVCGKKFTMSQHLHVHKRIHTGEKPYTCQVCGKNFRQVGNLDSHMKIHTGEKGFICSLCGKSFRQKISLETHERFHRKDKVYNCHACTKSFVQKVDLKRHMLTHSGEKPHACPACGKCYQEKRSLDAHMKVHAAAKRPTVTCEGHADLLQL
ncbi:gastrula zinc finger protein XlCGF57.1-like [Dunckerocampus dactyliophorus]|uniref:gastrula zinc finger protein XlCGF57.1-like n=1 Tax=Dunckerocampus dactyliophorus TaxID=161453 RepID=UPI0024054AEC|nr:gastrula zinc finger protein XlCGF57.1-like [Dunckerocampus dactyliophorus]